MFRSMLRFQKRSTILQVGAHAGEDGLIDACERFGHRLYLFEPIPGRAEELRRKAARTVSVQVIQKAVSNFDGKACFNVACHDECSSLQEFDEDANRTWVHPWHPFERFEVVDRIEVDVIRLDTFLEQEGLAGIDWLEVDTQGEDLRVVESLGERIRDVKKIQLEVNIHSSPLYKKGFTMDDAVSFFARHGFEKHVEWKQSLNREANVVFRNRRYYASPLSNRLSAFVEQRARTAYATALKLPRVLAVTRMMLRRRTPSREGRR